MTNEFPAVLDSYKEAQEKVSQEVADTKKCGDLVCQHDSFLKSLESSKLLRFSAFRESASSKKNKKKKNDVKKSEEEFSASSLTRFTMVLSDSVFFPEGGGQPADRGVISVGDLSLSISDAQNVNNVCVLMCEAPKEISYDKVVQAFSSGQNVNQVLDWDRRFDFMTQHSGQHLISAVALKQGLNTHSFSLGQNTLTSYIDFTVDAEKDIDKHYCKMMENIETIVNEHIRENLPMSPTWLDPDDPEFKTRVRSRLLPAGFTGKVRLVEIGGGVDFNTCCGTHVPTLGSLQMINFFKMEKVKGTTLRVHFAAGKRLMKIMESSYERQSKFTNMLSCNEDEHVTRLSALLEDKRGKEKEIKTLNEQLCECRAKDILSECEANGNIAVADLGAVDMAFMTMLSTAVLEKIGNSDGILLLFVAGPDDMDEGSFLLAGEAALVDKVGKDTAKMLAGRGGGRNGRFQGKGTKIRSGLVDVKLALARIKQI